MGTPLHKRSGTRIVPREIILRYIYLKTLILIPVILLRKSVGIVFRMAGYKELPFALFNDCYHLQDLVILYAGVPKFGLKALNEPQHFKQVTLHVDVDQLANFKKDILWGKFESFETFSFKETQPQEPEKTAEPVDNEEE